MRAGPCVSLLAAAALLGVGLAAQTPSLRDWRTFVSGVEVTSITVSVFDADGGLVTGLPREAFEVYEDGVPQQVTQFTSDRVPVSLGVLLDASDSMFGKRIRAAQAAIDRFLFELLDREDEFFVLAFNHEPRVLTPWTGDPGVVRQALHGLRPSGGTSVYDAVLAALPLVESRSHQRAALLLVSDGADTSSTATIRSVRTALMSSDAFVYAVAIDPPERRAINTRVNTTTLRELTADSGGRTEVVQSDQDLLDATARIAGELNHQYVLGYNPPRPPDGRYHTIRVKVRQREYRIKARNGYYASRRSTVESR